MKIQDTTGNELNLFDSLIAASHNVVVDCFAQEISSRSVIRMSEILMAQTEDVLEQVRQQRKPEIACAAGCSWCCRCSYVSVTTLEVLSLVEYIRAHFTSEQIDALKERATAAANRRRGLNADAQETLRLPCPLLENDRCSVYPARPLMCRGWTSRDAAVCRHNVEQTGEEMAPVPFYKPYKEIAVSVRVGIQSGIDQTPLQNDDLELIAALDVALNAPEIVERWLAGEKVFGEAAIQKDEG